MVIFQFEVIHFVRFRYHLGNKILVPDLHPGLKFGENQVNRHVSGLHCTWLVPCTKASSDDVNGTWRLAQSVFMWTLHHALWWDGRLVESQEGLETEVGPKADLSTHTRGLTERSCSLPRGTQISYSAVVDLVAELGIVFLRNTVCVFKGLTKLFFMWNDLQEHKFHPRSEGENEQNKCNK
ncbi:hypothetical protein M9H77_03042 [Catharanthus roseus]|uniref:Uncharacterized protein n=1 Tax=Catharanthus roseus TaxID=4058 RepID=A0ACC0CA28_CATRO|nr:hypothetical protein M9H77_03042 [Catharanthus roseus]